MEQGPAISFHDLARATLIGFFRKGYCKKNLLKMGLLNK